VQRRGNKRAGPVAIIIFIMIVALVITICWLFAQSLQKDLNGLPRGSQTLPAQAAQGTVTTSPPETGSAH
jgi:flagellar basal body-associated protein FliL